VSFQHLADVRRIAIAKAQLDELTWDVAPDPYQRLELTEQPELDIVFKLLTRRGLEPAIVTSLLAGYPDRPVERALIAYDVLRDSLLGPQDEVLVQRLVGEVAPLRGIATTMAAVPRDRVNALRGAFKDEDNHIARARRQAAGSTLPSLVALVLDGVDLASDATAREAIFAHCRLLAKAHLPSLAMAFLQIAFERFALPFARDMLVELGLDHDLIEAIPRISETDPASMQLQTYLLVRAALARFEVAQAAEILARMQEAPGVVEKVNFSLVLVESQLALMQGKQLAPAAENVVSQIASNGPGWRYARQVLEAVRMVTNPESIPGRLDSYLSTFGNDMWIWAQALTDTAARPAVLALLSRELRYGAHNPAVWRAVGFATGSEAIDNQISERQLAQLRAFTPTFN